MTCRCWGVCMVELEEMTWREYQGMVRDAARGPGIPVFGTFELTPLCNFACRMCYVRLAPEQMRSRGRLRSAGVWLRVADEAREMGMAGVTLTGGEALTHPDFPEIYTGLSDRGLIISVLSNGSLVNDVALDLFTERPPSHMRFTLYGSSNETYERLCGAPHGFDDVMRSLRALRERGIGFSLAFTGTALNIADLEDVERIAEELGVGLIKTTNLVPAIRGAASDADDLRTELPPRPTRGRVPRREASRPPRRRDPKDPFARCLSYRSSFWLDWDGSMELCAFMSSCGTRPFEDGFAAAWGQLLERLSAITVPEACEGCSVRGFCSACPGVLEAEAGGPSRTSEKYCGRARDLAARSALVREGDGNHEEGLHDPYDEGLCD